MSQSQILFNLIVFFYLFTELGVVGTVKTADFILTTIAVILFLIALYYKNLTFKKMT